MPGRDVHEVGLLFPELGSGAESPAETWLVTQCQLRALLCSCVWPFCCMSLDMTIHLGRLDANPFTPLKGCRALLCLLVELGSWVLSWVQQ